MKGEWRKRCSCGREHDHAAWRALRFIGVMFEGEPDAMEMRNCECGSTIAIMVEPEEAPAR